MMKIAIIDLLGLTYDGTTLDKRGLGGSESAVILMSKELSKLKFDVTVYNNCIDSEANPGIYDNVKFIDHSQFTNDVEYDIIISSRSVFPFFQNNQYAELCAKAKHKVVWMHDTFCEGDEHIEDMLNQGVIDELFTLSDFHTSYVLNCEHGQKRNFEVLKNKIFMTRNGAVKYSKEAHTKDGQLKVKYNKEINLNEKDKNHFVYNASVTKGLNPLLQDIWPEIKKNIPQAHLTVIGGFYRFREGAEPDEQEKDHRKYVETYPKELDVTFTGVIKQKEIAEILTNAGFMLYPTEFPETYGISTLESLLYKTPVITCNFGALEETAIDMACYKIDYANRPNSLFPHVNKDNQTKKFIELTLKAYNDDYLLQQKQNYCDVINDIYSWDTVALQWKQHFYKKCKKYLPVLEYRKVSIINDKVKRIYGRRFNTIDEYRTHYPEKRIVIISPYRNADDYIVDHCLSIDQQDYTNYFHIVIDDCSDNIIELPHNSNRHVIRNEERFGCIANQLNALNLCDDEDIIMLLDGDDFLTYNNTIFKYYNQLYHEGIKFTYGSCWSMVDNIPLIAQDYPEKVKIEKTYRKHHFNWKIPYTHLRTFSGDLRKDINQSTYKTRGKGFMMSGADAPLFYELIEAVPHHTNIKAVKEIMCLYNDINPLNDYKVNAKEQNENAYSSFQTKEENQMKQILIAIPTNKGIEPETFKSIYDLKVPDGVKTFFQFFHGYQIDQIRNLIADWGKRYDYVFCVDSDIILPEDSLMNLYNADKDIISGVYMQRKHDEQILELYESVNGNQTNMKEVPIGISPIEACGFGCVLIKGNVFNEMEYPHFLYKSAIDHAYTYSEDTYFCNKAREKGFSIWVDSSVVCGHKGEKIFTPELAYKKAENIHERLAQLSNMNLLPVFHENYMRDFEARWNWKPKIIFDIGASVLHWTKVARQIWGGAQFYAFDALEEYKDIYEAYDMKYAIGLLSDKPIRRTFYTNLEHPGGGSYYPEKDNKAMYEKDMRTMGTITLDETIKATQFPQPDLIKIDVQGAELDILKGATETLKHVKHIFLEAQTVEYNEGAPQFSQVKEFMEEVGFVLVEKFCDNGADADYHFVRKELYK